MKLLKRLPVVVGGVFALSVVASPAYAIVNHNGLSTNALSANALSANALSANALSANALSANALSANALSANALTANALSSNALNAGRTSQRHDTQGTQGAFALRDALRELGSQRLVADRKN